MIVGWGCGTTVAEVDDLKSVGCGMEEFVLLSPYLNWLPESPPERGRKEGKSERYGVRGFPKFPAVYLFSLIVVISIDRDLHRVFSRHSQNTRIWRRVVEGLRMIQSQDHHQRARKM